MQTLGGLALIAGILRRKAKEMIDARFLQFDVMIAKTA